jgi:hypothetical protein
MHGHLMLSLTVPPRKLNRTSNPPTTMTIALVERLKAGVFTTDRAILSSVTSWITYDERLKEYLGENHSGPVYAQSLAYLDGLLLYMYGRPQLEARLWERKAHLYRLESLLDLEIEASRKALAILDPAQVTAEQMQMDLKVRLGNALNTIGDTYGAEQVYLEVLAHDWSSVENLPEARSLMQESYVEAGLGLIECRKGNAAKLKSIEFLPAVADRLQPALSAALKAAQ